MSNDAELAKSIVDRLYNDLLAANSEIERLRAELKEEEEFSRDYMGKAICVVNGVTTTWKARFERAQSLITALANALEFKTGTGPYDTEDLGLIQRAREATKDES